MFLLGTVLFSLHGQPAAAGEPSVLKVRAVASGGGSYRFDVTVRHDDTGWDHYADRWEVLDASGKVLATRVLLHPHETEQPFTRSLSGVRIPAGLSRVIVRAHDKVHGNGSQTFAVDLPKKGS
ncbi:MAG: hypothetical protein HN403_02220 [Rhodospirillales bacterium]|nr:hypothetical protein [Rhodospirillales bacterium]